MNKSNLFNIYYKTSEKMTEVNSNSVKTIITSPPYWNLKNYRKKAQIGYDETYQRYLERLQIVWKECFRVLREDGSIWININYRTRKKQFYNIPYDIIKSMQKIGFKFQETFIWHKPSGIPSPPNNLSNHFEFLLFFTKENMKFEFKDVSWPDSYDLLKEGEIGNIWRVIKKGGNLNRFIKHPATYPNELVEKIVKITSIENDLILDPFLGSGTTLIASVNLKRQFSGFEINNSEYKKIIEFRIKNELGFNLQNQ